MAAQFGYVIFTITAKSRNSRNAELRPLDDLDGHGKHLLDAFANESTKLKALTLPKTDESSENAYRINKDKDLGRCILIQASVGPFGTNGRLVNVDDGEDEEYGDRQATMVDLRAMIAVPPGARMAVLLCERRSLSHLKGQIEEGFLKPIGKLFNVTFTVASHIDAMAWQGYLANATAYSVTAVYRSTLLEDLQPTMRKKSELRITGTGGVANRAAQHLRNTFDALTEGRSIAHVEIAGLRPADTAFNRDRYDMVLTDGDGKRRTITVEQGQLPQWIYVLDTLLNDEELIEKWIPEANRVLSAVQTNLPEGWARLARR